MKTENSSWMTLKDAYRYATTHRPRKEKAAQIMVDFQRDFCDEGGYAYKVFWGDRHWVESIIPNAALFTLERVMLPT